MLMRLVDLFWSLIVSNNWSLFYYRLLLKTLISAVLAIADFNLLLSHPCSTFSHRCHGISLRLATDAAAACIACRPMYSDLSLFTFSASLLPWVVPHSHASVIQWKSFTSVIIMALMLYPRNGAGRGGAGRGEVALLFTGEQYTYPMSVMLHSIFANLWCLWMLLQLLNESFLRSRWNECSKNRFYLVLSVAADFSTLAMQEPAAMPVQQEGRRALKLGRRVESIYGWPIAS